MASKEKKKSQPILPVIEGQASTALKPAKVCKQCKHIEYEGSLYKFCPIDGTELQVPETLKDVLKKMFTISTFIYQRQEAKWMFPISAKDLNKSGIKANFNIIGSRNSDNSADLYAQSINLIDKYDAQTSPFKRIGRYEYWETFYNETMKMKVTRSDGGAESLGDILKALIHNEITNPVCRQTMYFHVNLDHWSMTQPDDRIIEFTLDYNIQGSGTSITRSQFPSPEDIKLKDALALITDEVFYSRKYREIYTIEELTEKFVMEGRLFDNLNFRERSKKIQIMNVTAYILNEEIEALFAFSEIRESIKHVTKLRSHKDPAETLLRLFGMIVSNVNSDKDDI